MKFFGLELRRQTVTPEPPPAPVKPKPLPDLWTGLDLDERVQPSWAKIYASPLWQRDLAPWFRALLIQSLRALTVERDPERIHDLQVRIALLEGLIEQPEREHEKLRQLMKNRYEAGDDPDELRASR